MASYISGWDKPAILTALTVTCGAKQIPKSPAGRPATRWLMLSFTSTHVHTHAHTNTQGRVHAPRHGSQRRGQAGKEVLGWAAVRSSRNIRMFPLQQSAGISSKLTDRCFDASTLSLLALSCCLFFSCPQNRKKPLTDNLNMQWLILKCACVIFQLLVDIFILVNSDQTSWSPAVHRSSHRGHCCFTYYSTVSDRSSHQSRERQFSEMQFHL